MPPSQSKTLVAMSLQLGFSVAIPTVTLAYIGNRLDLKYGTGSVFLMIGLTAALAISLALVWQIVRVALTKLGHTPPRLPRRNRKNLPE